MEGSNSVVQSRARKGLASASPHPPDLRFGGTQVAVQGILPDAHMLLPSLAGCALCHTMWTSVIIRGQGCDLEELFQGNTEAGIN